MIEKTAEGAERTVLFDEVFLYLQIHIRINLILFIYLYFFINFFLRVIPIFVKCLVILARSEFSCIENSKVRCVTITQKHSRKSCNGPLQLNSLNYHSKSKSRAKEQAYTVIEKDVFGQKKLTESHHGEKHDSNRLSF